ncbi:hypothetical protein B0H17DRAFT_1129181 [Mycena rosella]|uniref:Uncharacterized protein n=1 Tax=Mycena rosella TaxID=1033263 RepID=A0AAD7GKN8_MYCRO|nr:hypothetical protein B0H17DRAFT_1129181 [Mycena rosella]
MSGGEGNIPLSVRWEANSVSGVVAVSGSGSLTDVMGSQEGSPLRRRNLSELNAILKPGLGKVARVLKFEEPGCAAQCAVLKGLEYMGAPSILHPYHLEGGTIDVVRKLLEDRTTRGEVAGYSKVPACSGRNRIGANGLEKVMHAVKVRRGWMFRLVAGDRDGTNPRSGEVVERAEEGAAGVCEEVGGQVVGWGKEKRGKVMLANTHMINNARTNNCARTFDPNFLHSFASTSSTSKQATSLNSICSRGLDANTTTGTFKFLLLSEHTEACSD